MIFQQNRGRNSRAVKALSLLGLALLSGAGIQAQQTAQQQEKEKQGKEVVYTSVDQMPEPSVNLANFLAQNLHYPEAAKAAGIQGRAVVQFVIDKNGNMSGIQIQRSIHPDCDEEVLRVLSLMPAWKPGHQNGEAVNVYYTLPVSFRLEAEDNTQKSEPNTDGDKIFTSVEHMPQPSVDINRFLAQNLHYPEAAKAAGIQGRTVVQFVIDKNGNMSGVKIQRSIHPDCDKEVLRVLRLMPAWKPGRQNGEAVAVYYTLPVSFRLAEDKTKPAIEGKQKIAGVMAAGKEETGQLKLYPNPANDEVKFYISLEQGAQVWVWVKDINGREVLRKDMGKIQAGNNIQMRLDIRKLPAGMYILEAQQKGKRTTGKFTVSR